MKKCGRENCEDHDCELCWDTDKWETEEPCDRCSIIGNGAYCQFKMDE